MVRTRRSWQLQQALPCGNNVHRRNRAIAWLVVNVVLLIVLTVVLGAVLGTKLANEAVAPTITVTASPTNSLNASPTSSTAVSPTGILRNTALSVTGWQSGSGFSIRLFYQGDDAYLRIIGFHSSKGSWSVFAQAKPGTPIAASSYNSNSFFGGSSVWNHNMMRPEILSPTNSIC